jgi:hypothetical protein
MKNICLHLLRLGNNILIILLVLLPACNNSNKIKIAKASADELLESIAAGSALELFPEERFPAEQAKVILTDLKNKCEFANRKGHFINDFYHKEINGNDKLSLIYEFYLKCDSIRFILTYELNDKVQLHEFRLEPIQNDNSLIKNQEKRLKF